MSYHLEVRRNRNYGGQGNRLDGSSHAPGLDLEQPLIYMMCKHGWNHYFVEGLSTTPPATYGINAMLGSLRQC